MIHSLFKKPHTPCKNPPRTDDKRIFMIPTEHIFANSAQPRKSFADDSLIRLADSIRQHGILQPLTVRRLDSDGTGDAAYEIVAGERRYRAARLLSMPAVPCIIIEANGKKSAELALIENIQREDLNIFEEAAALASLIRIYSLTQEEAAKRMSVSQSYVANKLRLLRLGDAEREKILVNGLTERHARALLRISEADKRLEVINHIVAHSLGVTATDEYIDSLFEENPPVPKSCTPRKLVIRDIRLFYNSVERAVSTMKQAGIDVTTERSEGETETVLTIRIPNNVSRETYEV